MHKHDIIWTTPSPFWPEATGAGVATMHRPSILRFASDQFMDEYLGVLSTDPHRLGEFRAKPETWRGPTPATATPLPTPAKAFALPLQRSGFLRRKIPGTLPTQSQATAANLKLYQPVHQRFYMVSAALVCQRTGMPDRGIDTSREEKVSFVLRRLLPPANDPNGSFNVDTWEEHAFVAVSPGKFAWYRVPQTGPKPEDALGYLLEKEETLPLFPARFTGDDNHPRRLLSGLIPVGRREVYMGAPRTNDGTATGLSGTTTKTARKVLFRSLVSEPWKNLVDSVLAFKRVEANTGGTAFDTAPSPQEIPTTRRRLREQLQSTSWLLLIDFAEYLKTQLPDVWNVLKNGGTLPAGPQADLLVCLQQTRLTTPLTDTNSAVRLSTLEVASGQPAQAVGTPNQAAGSLADALSWMIQHPDRVATFEATTAAYTRTTGNSDGTWPDLLYPLVDYADFASSGKPNIVQPVNFTIDPQESGDLASVSDGNAPVPNSDEDAAEKFKAAIDKLAALVVRALPATAAGPEPAPSAASQPSADLRQGWFVLRCIYERPKCGPLHDDVVSEPSEPFIMAAFFDPDAPARPLRIGLPIDTTPAGLRKFDKNTAFVMSDILCGQIKRMKGITFGDLIRSVLPWPLHKDLSVPDGGPCKDSGGNLGTICSLSIPIITICALILLMIMVSLLDLIFRWMPFFMICFPVPKFEAKKQT